MPREGVFICVPNCPIQCFPLWLVELQKLPTLTDSRNMLYHILRSKLRYWIASAIAPRSRDPERRSHRTRSDPRWLWAGV